jgi:hypothetical protein
MAVGGPPLRRLTVVAMPLACRASGSRSISEPLRTGASLAVHPVHAAPVRLVLAVSVVPVESFAALTAVVALVPIEALAAILPVVTVET